MNDIKLKIKFNEKKLQIYINSDFQGNTRRKVGIEEYCEVVQKAYHAFHQQLRSLEASSSSDSKIIV